jgi:hypothetical protein
MIYIVDDTVESAIRLPSPMMKMEVKDNEKPLRSKNEGGGFTSWLGFGFGIF